MLRDFLEEAGHDTIRLHQPRGKAPKGTAMSSLTREKLLELTDGSADLAASGVRVRPRGEDWVRVYLPKPLHTWFPLRTRPKTVVVDAPTGVLSEEDEDLLGMPYGYPYLFWCWDYAIHRLKSYSVVWAKRRSPWYPECPCVEEIEISATLAALPANITVPRGARNDDDELDDVVAKWPTDEPMSEDEVTDKADEGARNDDADPAMGDTD